LGSAEPPDCPAIVQPSQVRHRNANISRQECFTQILRRHPSASRFVRYFWNEPDAVHHSTTAVSLHSHTLHSKEGLEFIPRILGKIRPADAILRSLDDRHRRRTGREIPYDRLYWRPPLQPRAAYELEARQTRESLQVTPLVLSPTTTISTRAWNFAL
jgi:hypothetical protein